MLKPKYVLPPPVEGQFNYIIDIGAKWYRNYFYFFSTYACPGPNALSPTFESKIRQDGTPRRRQVCPLLHALYREGMGWDWRCPFGGRVHESNSGRCVVRAVSVWLGWNDQPINDGGSMSVPDEVRRDAERTGELVRKKLMEIMELQADIDTLLRGQPAYAVRVEELAVRLTGSPSTHCGDDSDPVRPLRAGGKGQGQRGV